MLKNISLKLKTQWMSLKIKTGHLKTELLFGIKILKKLCGCGIEVQTIGKHEEIADRVQTMAVSRLYL